MHYCCWVNSCGHKEHAQVSNPGIVLPKSNGVAQETTAERTNYHDATTIELVRKVGHEGEGDCAKSI